MIYKKYGIGFKNLRTHSGFVLSDFKSIGISKSTLSDFERGKTMIGLDKIDSALQFMGYDLNDYDGYINGYAPNDSNYILEEMEAAFLDEDSEKLKQLLKICEQSDQKIVLLSIKLLIEEDKLSVKEELTNYLYDAKTFAMTELSVFYILMPHIIPKDIINIIHNLKQVGKGITSDKCYHRKVALVLLEAVLILSNFNLKKEAEHYLKRVEALKITQSMLLRNLFYAVQGFWIYQFENKQEGLGRIDKFLEIMEIAAQPKVTKFYKRKFAKALNGKESNDRYSCND